MPQPQNFLGSYIFHCEIPRVCIRRSMYSVPKQPPRNTYLSQKCLKYHTDTYYSVRPLLAVHFNTTSTVAMGAIWGKPHTQERYHVSNSFTLSHQQPRTRSVSSIYVHRDDFWRGRHHRRGSENPAAGAGNTTRWVPRRATRIENQTANDGALVRWT